MELVHIGFLTITASDVLDVSLVTLLVYKLYQLIRGTRAVQMLMGLVLIAVISFIVQALEMSGMSWIIDNLKTVWIILFVILFQPELRRLLILAGQSRIIRTFVKVGDVPVLEEIALACEELSDRQYGGLIVLTRDTGVRAIVEAGVRLQAKVSRSLLVSIFTPRSPLHDGAVIINGDLIEAAKCILPLTQNPDKIPNLGTRHQAALGLSEEVGDAIVIAVSEETGIISIVEGGSLQRDFEYRSLLNYLRKVF